MLIGVLCEVVSAVATTEKDEVLARTVTEKMPRFAEEFSKIIESPEALHALLDVDVNPIGLVDFAELFL